MGNSSGKKNQGPPGFSSRGEQGSATETEKEETERMGAWAILEAEWRGHFKDSMADSVGLLEGQEYTVRLELWI